MTESAPNSAGVTKPQDPNDPWVSLRLLNSYRLFVAFVLLCAFLLSAPGVEFGRDVPLLFYVFASGYFIVGLVFAGTLGQRRPSAKTQAYLQFYTDIIALAGITYSSGGVDSGLATLLVVPVAGAGLLLPTRGALLYPALATLFLLTGEVVRQLQFGMVGTDYAQAALVSVMLFAVALVAALAARGRAQTAELAYQRSLDVRRLAELNDRIIQQMESGILVVDRDHTITLCNASAQQLLNQHAGELAGRRIEKVAPGLAQVLAQWAQEPRQPSHPVQPFEDGETEIQPQFTNLGAQGTLIAMEDARFIREQLQQLKLASLGRLTASIAHEIRNPLAAIQQSAQLLAESEPLTAEDRRLIEIQLEHCRRINGIVTNVLELSRQRPGPAPWIDLVEWLEAFAGEFRSQYGLDEHRLTVRSEAPPVPVRFAGEHLRQVVTNLCHNSLEHGHPPADDELRIALEQDRRDRAAIHLDISDNGEPIAPEQLDAIFEPFFTKSERGTGLGLFLAQELCNNNGAQLRYVRRDQGNRFRIHFDVSGDSDE